jgi:hypothetical protein
MSWSVPSRCRIELLPCDDDGKRNDSCIVSTALEGGPL